MRKLLTDLRDIFIKQWLMVAILLSSPSAMAELNVVATTTSMGMLASEVGGDHVTVKTLVAPDRDTHYLQAKPSMIIALRKADLVVSVGASLEIGWLPAAINSSANPNILDGKPGHFESATFLELIDKGVADRSQGDVHPEGNPHFNLDPIRMAEVAKALGERLASLDKDNAGQYRKKAEQLASRLSNLNQELVKKAVGAKSPLMMHKDANYLWLRLNVPILGYIEPLPGIPPTASHIKKLADTLAGKEGIIFHAPFHSASGPKRLAETLGWERVVIPIEPKKNAKFEDYEALLTRWVAAATK
ncbi:MAG: metal ABC transporter substrate-binding protein [Pseudomonadales bacterium]|nr:metal ABC transporter substrate-binding protein [Pseudomonadales bacterium]